MGGLVAGGLVLLGPQGSEAEDVSSAEEVSPILVGTTAPEGTVRTEDGKAVTLGSLRGGEPTVLVFFRGHW
jgi:hypothetical protein